MEFNRQIEGCINNNHDAQSFVFEKNHKKLMGVCVRYFDKIEDAEDAVSESFIKIFKSIKQFNGSDEKLFYCWIRKIAVNECLTKIRKLKKDLADTYLDNVDVRQEYETTYDEIGAKELLKMIQTLPRGFRTVFNLHAIEGYNHKEIGEMLGVSESTSKTQYFRAKNRLKLQLSKIGVVEYSTN